MADPQVKLELRLARLAQAESTGVLEVQHGKRRRRFWLREGALVASSSNLKKEQAADICAGLPPDATPETVNEHTAAQRLSAAMATPGGKQSFTVDEAPKRDYPASLKRVLWQALALAFDCEQLKERFESEFSGDPVCRTRGAQSLQSLELPHEYREWLVSLDGFRPVVEVVQFGPGEPVSCMAALYHAAIFNAVGFREVQAEVPLVRIADADPEEEELIDEDVVEGGSTDLSSLIASAVTPRGEPRPAGPGYELEVDEEAASQDADWIEDEDDWDESAAGDQEIPWDEPLEGDDEDGSFREDEDSVPRDDTEEWILGPEEAGLRAEIHRIKQSETVFDVLGLPHDSEFEEFRTSYFRLARILHPDRVGDDKPELQQSAAEAFDRARAAWEIVKDDELREETIARVIHGKKSEEEEAYEQVQELLAIEKLFDRGLAQFRSGRIVQAHEMFTQVITMSAKHPEFEVPEFRIYLGYCIWRVNHERDEDEAERGVEMLQGAMNKLQSHKEGWVLLGRVVKARGHRDQARKLFIRALKLDPENKDARRELERLKRERGGGDKPKGFFGKLFSRGKKKSDKKKDE